MATFLYTFTNTSSIHWLSLPNQLQSSFIFNKLSVSINCGNYSAISCSYCRYDPHTGAPNPGIGWCGGNCTWDAGHCVPEGKEDETMKQSWVSCTLSENIFSHVGCAFEPSIHYNNSDVDSSYAFDLPGCLSFCKNLSRFFTYDEGTGECYCKSSNTEPFVDGDAVSGEAGCPPGRWHILRQPLRMCKVRQKRGPRVLRILLC